MANQIPGLIITLKSSGDMSANQFSPVGASTANDADGCTVVATSGAAVTGIWLGNSTQSEYGAVQASGVAKVQADANDTAIAVGAKVYALGGAVTASTEA